MVNTHCHTGFCGHGEGEVEAYVAEAERCGLTTLAFTDHFPLSAAFDPVGYLSVPSEQLPSMSRLFWMQGALIRAWISSWA